MNQNTHNSSAVDASCQVPLLPLLGGAALWLVVGLVLELAASLTFHKPDMFAHCAFLTYGRVLPAANDTIVYGFAIPAALGVMLWIFARLSDSELELPLVPIVAANIWHLGVAIGLIAILTGDSTGFTWLEFPRAASVLLFTAFLLIATSAFATFGARRDRALQPAHWFLLAALFWFPWIYSTANLFLVAWPVRGVAQAVINWWFSNNLLFVWLGLVGLGVAFYILPLIAGRALQKRDFALFSFWTFILFAPWCGIPQSAPVPAWFPAASTVASALVVIPLIGITVVFLKTVCGANVQCKGGPFCYVKFGTVAFILATVMLILLGCSRFGRVAQFTWYVPAQTFLQIFGFFAIVICGAIYELLPKVMGFELPFKKFVRVQHWFFMGGLALLVLPLAFTPFIFGRSDNGVFSLNPNINANITFIDSIKATLPYLRVSTLGLLFLLLGSLMLAANIFVMTAKWKLGLLKGITTAISKPMETGEVKS